MGCGQGNVSCYAAACRSRGTGRWQHGYYQTNWAVVLPVARFCDRPSHAIVATEKASLITLLSNMTRSLWAEVSHLGVASAQLTAQHHPSIFVVRHGIGSLRAHGECRKWDIAIFDRQPGAWDQMLWVLAVAWAFVVVRTYPNREIEHAKLLELMPEIPDPIFLGNFTTEAETLGIATVGQSQVSRVFSDGITLGLCWKRGWIPLLSWLEIVVCRSQPVSLNAVCDNTSCDGEYVK